jgi:hypothetical protein
MKYHTLFEKQKMQSRSCFNTEIDCLPVCHSGDESDDDIFNQSTQKLNICGQTQNYFPKLVNNISTLTSSSLETNTSALPPKILKITQSTSALIGETAILRVRFTPLRLAPFEIKWSKKVKLIIFQYSLLSFQYSFTNTTKLFSIHSTIQSKLNIKSVD